MLSCCNVMNILHYMQVRSVPDNYYFYFGLISAVLVSSLCFCSFVFVCSLTSWLAVKLLCLC